MELCTPSNISKVFTAVIWHTFVCYYILTSVISPSLMPLLLLYPKTLGNRCSNLFLPPCCHIFLPYIVGFDILAIHHRIKITCSHASHCHHCIYCHYCNVNLVLFHNVKCYTNFLLSHIHANTTFLFNTTCMILVATCMIIRQVKVNDSGETWQQVQVYIMDLPPT